MGLLDKLKNLGKGNNNNQANNNPSVSQPSVSPASSVNKNGSMFRISRPYGYYIKDVDEVITKYNSVFTELKTTILSLKNEKAQLLNENKQIKSELRNMQMQMSMLQLPDTSETEDFTMLDKMKSITGEKRYDFSDLDSEFKSPAPQKSQAEKELEQTISNSGNKEEIILNNDAPMNNNNNHNNNNGGSDSMSVFDIID